MTHDHSPPGGVGFARIETLLRTTVTVARGPVRTVFTPAELETRLGIPGLGARFRELVASREEKPLGVGGSKQSGLSPNANAVTEISGTALALALEGSGEPSEGVVTATAPNTEAFARYLAQTFGDTNLRSLPFYRLVTRTVPRHIVLDALQRAKDAQDVRKSRAHLFSFLVRGHLPKRQTHRNQRPHV
jgi:hypothetical protein